VTAHALRIDGSLSIHSFIDGADSNVGMYVGVQCVKCGRTGVISTGDDSPGEDDTGQDVTAPLEVADDCPGKWPSAANFGVPDWGPRASYKGPIRRFT